MVSTIAAFGAEASGLAATAAALGAGAATIGGAEGNVLDFNLVAGAAFAGGAAFALDVDAVLAMGGDSINVLPGEDAPPAYTRRCLLVCALGN